MTRIYKNGVRQDEFGNPIQEPESMLDGGPVEFPFIIKGGHYDQIGKDIGAEIDKHNKNKEKEEQDKDLSKLENITKSFLKTNNLL